MRVPQEVREKGAERIFKHKMTKIFQNMTNLESSKKEISHYTEVTLNKIGSWYIFRNHGNQRHEWHSQTAKKKNKTKPKKITRLSTKESISSKTILQKQENGRYSQINKNKDFVTSRSAIWEILKTFKLIWKRFRQQHNPQEEIIALMKVT